MHYPRLSHVCVGWLRAALTRRAQVGHVPRGGVEEARGNLQMPSDVGSEVSDATPRPDLVEALRQRKEGGVMHSHQYGVVHLLTAAVRVAAVGGVGVEDEPHFSICGPPKHLHQRHGCGDWDHALEHAAAA